MASEQALAADNDRRLRALARRLGEAGGMEDPDAAPIPLSAEALHALRVEVYLEVLLGDRLAEAQQAFQVNLAAQITGLEAQADQLAAAMETRRAEEEKAARRKQLVVGDAVSRQFRGR